MPRGTSWAFFWNALLLIRISQTACLQEYPKTADGRPPMGLTETGPAQASWAGSAQRGAIEHPKLGIAITRDVQWRPVRPGRTIMREFSTNLKWI